CTGKFYYDLNDKREELGGVDVALVRVEQLFPLPLKEMRASIKEYKNAVDIIWAQEETRNMGAWSFLTLHMEEAKGFRVAARRFYGAPAAGSTVRSKRGHSQVLDYVFDRTKDNMLI